MNTKKAADMNTRPARNQSQEPINLPELLQYLGVNSQTREDLSEAAEALTPELPFIVDQFYDKLIQHEVTRAHFPNQSITERLKAAQYGYLKDILYKSFDEDYLKKRQEIGKTHERIGLLPRWYIGAYSHYADLFFPLLRNHFSDDPEKMERMQLALMKVFFLDMQIAMETYIARYSKEMIDAQRAMEQKLWMEDRILTFILTEATDAFIGLDEQGRIVTWSQGAQQLFHLRTTEVVDRSLYEFVVDKSEFTELHTRASSEGSATYCAMQWRDRHGNDLTADTTLTMLQDENGTHVGSSLLLRDTTEIRRLASKVKNMEQLHAMTKITAGVAHEIRTPLGVIALTADLISDRVSQLKPQEPTQEQQAIANELDEMLGDLQLEVERLNEIVNHYLVLSRIKRPKRIRMALQPYLESIMNDLRERVSGHPLELQFESDVEGVHVEIDTDHIRRVFLNLFDNSRHAIQPPGTIRIRTETQNDRVRIYFSDTGKGIPPENMKNLFVAFETYRVGGTGLGLYLVHEIVEAHEGTVHIDSTVGEGTTVTIGLPIVV